jgi:hypothetical protein
MELATLKSGLSTDQTRSIQINNKLKNNINVLWGFKKQDILKYRKATLGRMGDGIRN